jgi:hypothetical protein
VSEDYSSIIASFRRFVLFQLEQEERIALQALFWHFVQLEFDFKLLPLVLYGK